MSQVCHGLLVKPCRLCIHTAEQASRGTAYLFLVFLFSSFRIANRKSGSMISW